MNFLKRVWNGVKSFVSPKVAATSVTLGTGLSAFAQTAPADPTTAIGSAITTILAIIAAGGAGYITLKLAHVGWVVGAKFIGRLGAKS